VRRILRELAEPVIMQTRIFTNNTPPRRISRRRFAPHGRETLIAAAIENCVSRPGRIHETTKIARSQIRLAMLFDTSPIDDPDSSPKKKGRKKPAQAAVAHTEPPPVDDALAAILNRPAVILGRLDNHVACHRCMASCHDIVDDSGKDWLIECAFCGLKEWFPAIEGYLQPREVGFVFRDGRFSGKTVEEAFDLPRGRDYVEWAAKEHKRPIVREACEKFLLTRGAAVG